MTMPACEVQTIVITLPSGDEIEQCLIRESETGLFFSLDASYVEQEVAPIRSPYGHGTLLLPEGCDASEIEPDVLAGTFGDGEGMEGEHPQFSRKAWQSDVAGGNTSLGYWEWVSREITA